MKLETLRKILQQHKAPLLLDGSRYLICLDQEIYIVNTEWHTLTLITDPIHKRMHHQSYDLLMSFIITHFPALLTMEEL